MHDLKSISPYLNTYGRNSNKISLKLPITRFQFGYSALAPAGVKKKVCFQNRKKNPAVSYISYIYKVKNVKARIYLGHAGEIPADKVTTGGLATSLATMANAALFALADVLSVREESVASKAK